MTSGNEDLFAKQIGKYLYCEDISVPLICYIKTRRWFRRKSEKINRIVLRDYAVLSAQPTEILTIIEIFYENFHSEIYYFPIYATKNRQPEKDCDAILDIKLDGETAYLYDAFSDIRFCAYLLKLIRHKKQVRSLKGVFSFYPTETLEKIDEKLDESKIKLISTEQSNTSINYSNSLIMKNFRNIEYGLNPDFEISYFLTKEADLKNIPALMGYIEYQNQDKMTATAAVLQEFITNQGDCWSYTLIQLEQILRTAMRNCRIREENAIKNAIKDFSKEFIDEMYRLGEVTGEFHKALTTDCDDNNFKAEVVTAEDAEHWYCYMVTSVDSILDKIKKKLYTYPKDTQKKVSLILDKKCILIEKLKNLQELKNVNQKKIRIHGDYHLGQVLKTQEDFVILDFEGEPIKTLEERRAKFLPQKDLAGMLRSFNYATNTCLYELPGIDEEELANLKNWADTWEKLVSEAFLNGYFDIMKDQIEDMDSFQKILTAYQIDKAIYELDYEINNRPDWLKIPVEYLKSVVENKECKIEIE